MFSKKINKTTIIIFIILCFSTVYLIIYKINSNYSIKEIEKKITSRINKDVKIKNYIEYDNQEYFVFSINNNIDYIGFASFQKNMFGEYTLYWAGSTDGIDNISKVVNTKDQFPLLCIVYGHDKNKEIYRIEVVMRNSDKNLSEYISNEEYYIKVLKFKEIDYVKAINYYDKDDNLIKSKKF